tara:strand:+ start:641 stop:772 length:132 start_codon:yes stop_codon:yes gene_type:complete
MYMKNKNKKRIKAAEKTNKKKEKQENLKNFLCAYQNHSNSLVG